MCANCKEVLNEVDRGATSEYDTAVSLWSAFTPLPTSECEKWATGGEMWAVEQPGGLSKNGSEHMLLGLPKRSIGVTVSASEQLPGEVDSSQKDVEKSEKSSCDEASRASCSNFLQPSREHNTSGRRSA